MKKWQPYIPKQQMGVAIFSLNLLYRQGMDYLKIIRIEGWLGP